MTMSSLLLRLHCLKSLCLICLICFFIPVSNASTKHVAETDATTAQLMGVMYNNQQMQLETIKVQQRLELEKVHDKLSLIDAHIDNFQSDLDSQKLVIESGKQETAALGKRIDDYLIYAGQSLDRFGLCITIGLALVGFVGYFSFAEKTKREAKNIAEEWFNNHTEELQKTIRRLEDEAKNARNKMSEHVGAVERTAEEVKAVMQRNTALVAPDKPESGNDSSIISPKETALLKGVPTSDYKFSDWNSLAYTAYSNEKFEEAVFYWLKALEAPDINNIESAMTLYNRGVVQRQLNQHDASIKSCDEVVDIFGNATELVLKELVAKALLVRGFAQFSQNLSDAAMSSYDDIVYRFGNSRELKLKQLVAIALNNKGGMQIRINNFDGAIHTFDELLCRFGSEEDVSLKEEVAKALINKAFSQMKLRLSDVAMQTYEEVIHLFGDKTEAAFNIQVSYAHNGMGFEYICKGKHALSLGDVTGANVYFNKAITHLDKASSYTLPEQSNGLILGNRAYALALLGSISLAEESFAAALRSPVDGGKKLYEETLNDFDIYPIPQDESMRNLVNQQWNMWLAENSLESESSST